MTAWSMPALGMMQTDRQTRQTSNWLYILEKELGKALLRDANADQGGSERAEGSWEMGPRDLAVHGYYMSFFNEEMSLQIRKLTPRPAGAKGVLPVCRNTDV